MSGPVRVTVSGRIWAETSGNSSRERFAPTSPAFSAIGYREAWAVVDGELTLPAAIELDVTRNVAFAKRQRTWFRSEPDIAWLSVDDDLPVTPAFDLARRAVEEPSPTRPRG